MKKIISQISLILIIFSLLITIANISMAADSAAGINCPSSVQVGQQFNVSLILPANAHGADANVKVTYSDGTSETKRLVYAANMTDFPNLLTFTAASAGTATITVTNINLCDKDNIEFETNGTKMGTLTVIGSNPSNSGSTSTSGSTDNSGNADNSGGNANAEVPPTTASDVKFTDVNETVYTTKTCNIRKSYSADSEKLGKLAKYASIKRTGVGENGWSRVEYNGQVAYMSSQYLTTTQPQVDFKDVNETMYAIQDCNVRKSYSTDSEKVGYLKLGQEITRTGVGDNGWSKIKYNGQDAYVATRLLSSEKPQEENTNNTNTNTNTNVISNTNEVANQNTISNASNTDTELTREQKLKIIQEEVGVLPEVGNNVAVVFYIAMTLLALVGVASATFYIKKIK